MENRGDKYSLIEFEAFLKAQIVGAINSFDG